MAELVGVVASGIGIATLAAHVANSAIQLKRYWSELKEAPEDIRLLIEEVEDIQLVLSEIEEDQRCNPISRTALGTTSASRCLEHCKKGADLLKNLADELGAEIKSASTRKKAWASAKVILKRDRLEKYRSRLERAIRVLTVSYQSYSNALMRLQPEILVSHFMQSATYLQHSKGMVTPTKGIRQDQHVTEYQPLTSSSKSKRTKRSSLGTEDQSLAVQYKEVQHSTVISRLRLQVRFINQAWNTELLRTRSGWTENIRMHNVIPYHSSTYDAIMAGNVSMLQELFQTGQASPFDMFEYYPLYTTLLDLAVAYAHPAMCKFLIQQSEITDEERYSAWPLKLDYVSCNVACRANKTESTIAIALMLKDYQSLDLDSITQLLQKFRGPEEVFQLLKQFLPIPYHELPLETRITVAMEIAHKALFNSPRLFEMALDEHPISADAIAMQMWNGTLLNSVARAIGNLMTHKPYSNVSMRSEKDLPGWQALLCELVTGGADLHSVADTWWNTDSSFVASPFLCLFIGLTEEWSNEAYRYIAPMLDAWLEALLSCGVDLLEYGRKEKAWQQSANPIRMFRSSYRMLDIYDQCLYGWRLIGFDYGPLPSDWHIYMADPSAELAGGFWQIIESPEPQMPGSWLD